MSKKKIIRREPFTGKDGSRIYPIYTDDPNAEAEIMTAEEMLAAMSPSVSEEMTEAVTEEAPI